MPYDLQVMTSKDVSDAKAEHLKPGNEIVGDCIQCGNCCRHYGCPLVDITGGPCPIYDHRPIGCRQWPHRQFDIIAANCPGYTCTHPC